MRRLLRVESYRDTLEVARPDVFAVTARACFNRLVDRMRSDRSLTERILGVLRPYASNWSGTLGRGDLVIPQRDIPRVVHEILDAMHDENGWEEVGEREVVEALLAIRRSPSVQDQADRLRRQFAILRRTS